MGGGIGKERAQTQVIAMGPWGGIGGKVWDDGTHTGVREIKLVYGHCIDSFSVVYDNNGEPSPAEKHGGSAGNGGTQIAEIKLQYPEEYIVSVSGHYGPFCGPFGECWSVIRSLSFKTNKRTFGPYGVDEGASFTFSVPEGVDVGFFGRNGWFLDAIGICVSQRLQSPNNQAVA